MLIKWATVLCGNMNSISMEDGSGDPSPESHLGQEELSSFCQDFSLSLSLSLSLRQTDRQTDRQRDTYRQTGRQAQTDRQTDRHRDRDRETEAVQGHSTQTKKSKTSLSPLRKRLLQGQVFAQMARVFKWNSITYNTHGAMRALRAGWSSGQF